MLPLLVAFVVQIALVVALFAARLPNGQYRQGLVLAAGVSVVVTTLLAIDVLVP